MVMFPGSGLPGDVDFLCVDIMQILTVLGLLRLVLGSMGLTFEVECLVFDVLCWGLMVLLGFWVWRCVRFAFGCVGFFWISRIGCFLKGLGDTDSSCC